MSEFRPGWMNAVAEVTAPVWAAVGGAVLLLSSATFFLWPTHPALGTIRATSWQHATDRQAWSSVVHEDWCGMMMNRAEVPPQHGAGERAGIFILKRERRYYGQKSYVCGTTRDSQGHTHTRYCSRPEYRDYCTYQTQVWTSVEVVHRSGTGTETEWFTFSDLPDDQRQVRSGKWSLTLRLQDRTSPYVYSAGSEEEYLRILHQDPNRVLVNLRPFGFVKSVEPFHWESFGE